MSGGSSRCLSAFHQGVDRIHRDGDPHTDEDDPVPLIHLLPEEIHRGQELTRWRDVLKHPDGAQTKFSGSGGVADQWNDRHDSTQWREPDLKIICGLEHRITPR